MLARIVGVHHHHQHGDFRVSASGVYVPEAIVALDGMLAGEFRAARKAARKWQGVRRAADSARRCQRGRGLHVYASKPRGDHQPRRK